MAGWADVYVSNADDRITLQSKALFLIPTALELLNGHQINANVLSARAATARGEGARGIAGRSAISKVMSCEPVVYESATGFIAVANRELEVRDLPPRFDTSAIVACVFELQDFAAVAEQLKLQQDNMAVACDVPRRIIASALEHYRLQFVHADRIWRHCLQVARQAGVSIEVLTDDPKLFIRTRVARDGRASIKKTVQGYVYEREDLAPAPATGHPWAVG